MIILHAFKPDIVRCVPARIDPGQLEKDLAYLQGKALSKGACDCAVIKKTDIVSNPDILRRVESDNRLPSVHWPLDYPRDDLNEAIEAYEWAVFFQIAIDPSMPDPGGGPIEPTAHRQKFIKTYEIVTVIESSAFYMGYHLAIGLASGNCRAVFCPEQKRCPATLKGRTCIRPNMGRPAMEAAGIDARAMAAALNWETPPEPAPFLGGLVMIH